MFKKTCSGIEFPFDGIQYSSSDYKLWNSINFLQSHCVFGKRDYYIRLRSNRICLNPLTYSEHNLYYSKTCFCLEEDWEPVPDLAIPLTKKSKSN